DAHEQFHVERIVMGDERTCLCTAGDCVHHWRLDFEEAALVQIIAHLLDDQAALDERLFGTFTCNQVQITFAVTLLYIFQAVIFIRQRSERLYQRSELLRLHRKLSCVRLEHDTFDTDNITKIRLLPYIESFFADLVLADINLDLAVDILALGTTRLAFTAFDHPQYCKHRDVGISLP